jgi:hypothetical protein
MEFLKTIFGDKAMTFDEFKTAVETEGKIKLVNLADGKYVDRNKLDDKTKELNAANDTIAQLKKDGEDTEKMKKTIADYEAKEQKRLDDEKAANELKALKDRFTPLKGDKSFLNEGTENWIFEQFKSALSLDENKGKSDADIYEAITKDKNIYATPNKKIEIPSVGGAKQDEKTEFKHFF